MPPMDSPPPTLTPVEAELSHWIQEANSDREIAKRMEISHGTVRFHLSNLFRKFGVRTRTQLAVKLLRK